MLYKIATTLRKGLLPQLSGTATDVLKGDGTFGAASSATIGGTISGGHATRVLYQDTGPVLADDANFLWIKGTASLLVNGDIVAINRFGLGDVGGSQSLYLVCGTNLSVNRTLTIVVADADKTIDFSKNDWATWSPSRTNWTDVGTPTVTARYCQTGNVVHFQIKVVPSTSVATTAGTSYTSLPASCGASALSGMGMMQNLTTLIAVGNCVIDTANSRCYVPTQAASGNTFLIAGSYEV